ncbi:MAG: ABC transporter substrate-binding protein [Nostoc sp.]|uniref:ABC transporter substrate-binding protein n=1 Tax=Nostoc sp. TaxID=1180 RepID=UPI002FF1E7B6
MDCCSGVSVVLPTDPMPGAITSKRLNRPILKLKWRSLFVVRLSRQTDGGLEQVTVVVARIKRRQFVQGLTGAAIALSVNSCRPGEPPSSQTKTQSTPTALKKVNMGFCSYLICAIPFEVARKHGFFAEEGLDINLIYLRGGAAPIQALVGGSVDYGAGSYDAVVQAVAKGAKIQRFVSTSNTPHSTLITSPQNAAKLSQLKDLEGRTVGVGELGGSAQNIVSYMMKLAGANPDRVQFTVLGPNIYDAVRLNQVDTAMVNEPATTLLLQQGAKALVNLSDPDVAKKYLGGRYEGMGVVVRTAEREQRLDEMKRIVRALNKCCNFMRTASAKTLVDAIPKELIAGGNRGVFEASIDRDRKGLIPEELAILPDAAQRAIDLLTFVGKLQPGQVKVEQTIDLAVVKDANA